MYRLLARYYRPCAKCSNGQIWRGVFKGVFFSRRPKLPHTLSPTINASFKLLVLPLLLAKHFDSLRSEGGGLDLPFYRRNLESIHESLGDLVTSWVLWNLRRNLVLGASPRCKKLRDLV